MFIDKYIFVFFTTIIIQNGFLSLFRIQDLQLMINDVQIELTVYSSGLNFFMIMCVSKTMKPDNTRAPITAKTV